MSRCLKHFYHTSINGRAGKRIRGRKTEAEEIVQQRLAKAAQEMKMIPQYKYIVCNDDPKLAAELITTIILRHIELEENK